jgi:hypothetical protein
MIYRANNFTKISVVGCGFFAWQCDKQPYRLLPEKALMLEQIEVLLKFQPVLIEHSYHEQDKHFQRHFQNGQT